MIRIKLWHRVFGLTALATLLALVALLLVQQRSFQSGLLGYVNQLNRERAEAQIPALATEFRDHGGWDRLRRNPSLFRQLMDPESGEQRLGGRRPRGPGAGPRADWGDDGRPGPGLGGPDSQPEDQSDFVPPARPESQGWREPPPRRNGDGRGPPRERPPPPRAGAEPGDVRSRYALYDVQEQVIIGPPEPWAGSAMLPVQVDDELVGHLAFLPLPRLESSFDLDFARSQMRSGVVTALLVLLLASLASMVFARRLANPLRGMADSAKRIAGGDYAARVAMDRSDEIGELANDFNAMAEALEKNRDARQRWTAEISHELRTPIAVMRAELDALEDGVRPINHEALHSLSAEAQRLSRLVDDLYQLSLADSGALAYRFEAEDLSELLAEALQVQESAFARAGLTLEADLLPSAPIRADSGRLAQLWANLGANSCRYTDPGGRVRVSLRGNGTHWLLCWEDSAPGVPDSALARMFDPLYRVDASRSRAAGGAGLGLAIVRRIVDAHGASMHAEASPLGGVAIHIRWPRT